MNEKKIFTLILRHIESIVNKGQFKVSCVRSIIIGYRMLDFGSITYFFNYLSEIKNLKSAIA